MRDLVLSGVKVGDKLFVKSGTYDKGCIEIVERVTKTGRVVIRGERTFNQDGWMRGGPSWRMPFARPATADDIVGVNRYFLVSKLAQFTGWEKLNADDLKAVAEIIAKYEHPHA